MTLGSMKNQNSAYGRQVGPLETIEAHSGQDKIMTIFPIGKNGRGPLQQNFLPSSVQVKRHQNKYATLTR
jgi:hypothetical protein